MINFMPFPKLETKHIVLRRMNYNDNNDLFEMRKDPAMNEYVDTKLEENPDETKAYTDKMNKGVDDNKWIIWAIEHKQSNKSLTGYAGGLNRKQWLLEHEKEILKK